MTNGVLYTPELADLICDEIATETRSLEEICADHPDFPHHRAIYQWLRKHPEFERKYRVARIQQIEPLVGSMLGRIRGAKTREQIMAAIAESKIVMWLAGHLVPRLYGDRLVLSDPEGGPVKFVLERMGEKKDAEL